MRHIEKLIREWGENKGITGDNGKATIEGQLDKLREEVQELVDGSKLYKTDEVGGFYEMIDAIGDIQVVLILLCQILESNRTLGDDEVTAERCLELAYHVIKDRTGKMMNGIFVKDV